MRTVSKTERRTGAIELTEAEMPSIGPNDCLIAPAYAGLCGSDAGIYKFKDAFEVMDLPTTIGHEYAGEIVETGENVTTFEEGQAVIERPIRKCGECYLCQTGYENVCEDARVTGVHHDGAYAEYVAVPEDAIHPLPEGMSLQRGALVEPTAVSTRATVRNAGVDPGDRVLVEGPGPIGLLAAQVAATEGAEVVVSGVGSDADYRLPLATDLGFRTVNVAETDIETVVDEVTDGLGFDSVIDTTGHPSGIQTGAEAVRNAGTIVVVGLSDTVEFDISPLVRSEVDIQCSYTYDYEDVERAVRLLQSGAIDADAFVDTQFSLHDVDEAFQAFLHGETCKPIFDVSELRE